jgi:Carboxypeptidase regulatory-like domain
MRGSGRPAAAGGHSGGPGLRWAARRSTLKTSVAALLALVALAVLAAIAFHSLGGGEPQVVAPAAMRAEGPAQHEGQLAPLTALPAGATEERAEVEAPANQPATSTASKAPAARCALTGRVVDGHRLALAGVGIRLERFARENDEPELPRAESGADGRFRVELDVPDVDLQRRMRVVVERDGYARLEREVVLAAGEQDLGELALADAGAVEGLVLDPRGAPIAGLKVVALRADLAHQADELDGPFDSDGRTTTDAQGRFALRSVPVGRHLVGAGGEGWAWGYARDIDVRAREVERNVVLRLERLPDERWIELVVLTPTGEPVPKADVQYTYSSESQSGSGSSNADAQGRYRQLLQILVPHSFTASDPDHRFGSAVARDVAPGTRGLELRLAERRMIELLVRGADGRPVESFRASASSLDRNSQQIAAAMAEKDPSGRAEMIVPGEPFRLAVDAEGFARPELEPFDPRTVPSSLEIVLQPLPGVSGVVLRAGEPVGGARVMLIQSQAGSDYYVNSFPVRSEPWGESEARSSDDGRFRLTLRENGNWFVRAELEGCAPAEIGPFAIEAAVGASELELALGAGGAIEGRLRLPQGESPAGAIIGLSRGDGFGITRRADADGAYRFERLTPGRWLVKRCRSEILPGSTTSTSTGRDAGELPWSCVVVEGQVTRFDLDLSTGATVMLEGSLMVSGAPASGWMATLRSALGPQVPPQQFELDPSGRFHFELDEGGTFELELRTPPQHPALKLAGRLQLEPGTNRFDRSLELGALAGTLHTLPKSDGDRIRYGWSQSDLTFSGVLDPAPDGTFRIEPAPAGEIVFRRRQADRRNLEIGRAVVPPLGEAWLELP